MPVLSSHARFARLFTFTALAAAACTPTDRRCSVENCEAIIYACRVFPSGTPNINACLRAGLRMPPVTDPAANKARINAECAEACIAGGSGAIVECVAGQKYACLDAGFDGKKLVAAQSVCLVSTGKSANVACETACNTANKTCEDACPKTTWDDCISCVKPCSLNHAHCLAGC
mgnify:CR=1 FL=1